LLIFADQPKLLGLFLKERGDFLLDNLVVLTGEKDLVVFLSLFFALAPQLPISLVLSESHLTRHIAQSL
jgi:hypothetical protein